MVFAGAVPPVAETARAPEGAQPSRDPRRRLLRPKERLPVADVAEGLSALEDRVPPLQGVEARPVARKGLKPVSSLRVG